MRVSTRLANRVEALINEGTMRLFAAAKLLTATLLLCLTVDVSAATANRVSVGTAPSKRPNILFAIADDWGWPHAGAYGDPVVKTPAFDRLAREGLLFRHAYVSSPSCTPSRGAILTGQWHWRLGPAANLWSVFPDRLMTYPEQLAQAGYAVGCTGKAWGPGRTETRGRAVAGPRFKDFQAFLEKRSADQPFCFWLGTGDPHRPYRLGSGKASGMELEKIKLPACFPDHPEVRGDVADYYFEVQRFDRLVAAALKMLEERGELDNTLVLMTGDHGMPFPRCKSNLYDSGTRVPLAVRWPKGIPGGRVSDDFVSLTDLAPTYLELAGIAVPGDVTGRSLVPLLAGREPNAAAPRRASILFGKERHVVAQQAPDQGGYPCRAIRTYDFLLIRNFEPDRWPAGTPLYARATIPGAWLADCDNGPTKSILFTHRETDALHQRLYDLSFAKRPEIELYDLRKDPHQLVNVATDERYAQTKARLTAQLTAELRRTGDPRVVGGGEKFDRYPYLGGAPKVPPSLKLKTPDKRTR